MPVYQYVCNTCGHELEARQSFHDDPLSVCPACEGALRKKISAAGVVFKGSGFYRNDSRAAATSGQGSGSGSSNGTGTDSSGSGPSTTSDSHGSGSNGSGSNGSGSNGTGSGSTSGSSSTSKAPATS